MLGSEIKSHHVWSHSSLNCWQTCQRQFYHRYVAKDATFESSPQLERGNLVHDALKLRLTENKPLPEDMPYERFAAALPDKGLLVECPMGMSRAGEERDWWSADVFGRGRPDAEVLPLPETLHQRQDSGQGARLVLQLQRPSMSEQGVRRMPTFRAVA